MSPATAACKIKAIFVQPPAGVPEKAILFTGQKFLDLELPRRNLSTAVELPPGGDLVLAVLTERLPVAEVPITAPRFKIPGEWTDCILLFFHDAKNPVFPARVIPVNASGANFPPGHTAIFNVSQASIILKYGGELVHMKPGENVTVKPPRSGSGAFPIAIDCAYPGDKAPTALCRSTWQHEANARQILFITPQPEQRIPRIWGVLDHSEEARKGAR